MAWGPGERTQESCHSSSASQAGRRGGARGCPLGLHLSIRDVELSHDSAWGEHAPSLAASGSWGHPWHFQVGPWLFT